jgi:mono/diheme cytochrome c family protein
VAPQGTVQGPMAEVVLRSTQFWSADDLAATATYLQALPQTPLPPVRLPAATPRLAERGAKLYAQHCAQCHGDQGQGVAGAYPALAGNRAVTLANPANLVHTVRNGGFAPATTGHPRPFGMPPFVLVLGDADIAAVLTHIRTAWGNQAAGVTELDLQQRAFIP